MPHIPQQPGRLAPMSQSPAPSVAGQKRADPGRADRGESRRSRRRSQRRSRPGLETISPHTYEVDPDQVLYDLTGKEAHEYERTGVVQYRDRE